MFRGLVRLAHSWEQEEWGRLSVLGNPLPPTMWLLDLRHPNMATTQNWAQGGVEPLKMVAQAHSQLGLNRKF